MASDNDLRLQAEAEAEAELELELEQQQSRPTAEIRSATPTSWGIADPIRKGLYAVTGDEMFDDMKGVPIQEDWNNGSLEGYSYGGKLRNALATGNEVAGNVIGGAGAGLIPGVGWLGIGTGATAGDLAARGLNRAIGLRPLEDVNTGEKIGLTDPYTSFNPLENPAALNLGIPMAGNLAGKLASRQALKAKLFEDSALGVKPKIDFKALDGKRPQITFQEMEDLKASPIYPELRDAPTFEKKFDVVAGKIDAGRGEVKGMIEEADAMRVANGNVKIKPTFSNAKNYAYNKSFIPSRTNTIAEFNDVAADLKKYLKGSTTELNEQKSLAQAFENYKDKDPSLMKAFATDLKEAVEESVSKIPVKAPTVAKKAKPSQELQELDRLIYDKYQIGPQPTSSSVAEKQIELDRLIKSKFGKLNSKNADKAPQFIPGPGDVKAINEEISLLHKIRPILQREMLAEEDKIMKNNLAFDLGLPFRLIRDVMTSPDMLRKRGAFADLLSGGYGKASALANALDSPVNTQSIFDIKYPAGINTSGGEISINPAILRALLASAQKSNDNEGQ